MYGTQLLLGLLLDTRLLAQREVFSGLLSFRRWVLSSRRRLTVSLWWEGREESLHL